MIKFRAWVKESKKLIPVESIDLTNKVIYYSYWQQSEEGNNLFGDAINFEETIIMQSTGLFDTNGTEIFEGDIVRVTDGDERTDFPDGGIGTICGLDDLYMWYIDGQVNNGLFDISEQYYIDVIGNIHQHPDLLESVEE